MSRSTSPALAGFDSFQLHPLLTRGVAELGFEHPRPVQIQAIPAALAGRDVLGLAQTGTGKTAAFALPILQRLLDARRPGPRALVVAPTRELAQQIQAEFRALARFTKLTVVTVYGGVGQGPQVNALKKGPDVVVACPGRLLDLHAQGHVRLGSVEVLVLDEADHMFDMGFLPDVRRILAALPARRQNLLFSATMPREIRALADRLLERPHVVELGHSAPAETIEHALYPIAPDGKNALLDHILRDPAFKSAIVFLRTKHRARRLAEHLSRGGHRAVALQGNMSQGQRERAMTGFRTGRFDVLVATDIAARGIDVANISHVINYDVPNTPDAYTHRIGRTGRSEQSGMAFTFVSRVDAEAVRAIERRLGAAIPRLRAPGDLGSVPDLDLERPPRTPAQGRGGRRGLAASLSGQRRTGGRTGGQRRVDGGRGAVGGRGTVASFGAARPGSKVRGAGAPGVGPAPLAAAARKAQRPGEQAQFGAGMGSHPAGAAAGRRARRAR